MLTCPDCNGTGYVVGELSSSRLRCLRCKGEGRQASGAPPDRRDAESRAPADPALVEEPAHQ